jgi:hypothetical protein
MKARLDGLLGRHWRKVNPRFRKSRCGEGDNRMANGPSRDCGSRKHILDLIESRDFVALIGETLKSTNVRLAVQHQPRPRGRIQKADWAECSLEVYLRSHRIQAWSAPLDPCWWVIGRGNRPTWDLLCHVLIGKKPGLLLVEAKAHEGELIWAGKPLAPTAKRASKENHNRIAGCISEANSALNKLCQGFFNLGLDSHYQLANRVAYAWKLASLGLPVVLMYLGFVGDIYFADYIRDDPHWQRIVGGYLQGVVSQHFPEKTHHVAQQGSVQMLIRTLSVKEVSKRLTAKGPSILRPIEVHQA